MRIFDYIDERVEELLGRRRMGFYVGRVSNALQSWRRVAVDAEWGPTLERVRRISSPVLDVIPARGTRLAVFSQDGVPEFGAVIGQIWDDLGGPELMSAWLRANLEKHPGHIELGATQGLRIVVGENVVDIEPTATGRIEIKAEGSVVVNAPEVRLGSAGASDAVALEKPTRSELDALWLALNTHVHPVVTPGAGSTFTPVIPLTPPTIPDPAPEGMLAGASGPVGAEKVTAE